MGVSRIRITLILNYFSYFYPKFYGHYIAILRALCNILAVRSSINKPFKVWEYVSI